MPELRTEGRGRVWEIDFLRGIAIILMVFYHLLYDLREFCGITQILGIPFNPQSVFMNIAQNFFAGVFVLLCGISSTFSRSNLKRGLKLIGIAIIITAATYAFDPSQIIHFGIIHCLGASILIYALLFEKPGPLVCAAAGFFVFVAAAALWILAKPEIIHFDWLLPFGIHSSGYRSFDYFPLLPWLGVFMIGAAAGKYFYTARQSLIKKQLPGNFINFTGRNSLLIYVFHQPVLVALIYGVKWISGLI